jgi:hypothetical protein
VSQTPSFDFVWWDGARLGGEPIAGGRRLGIDRRCLEGEPVPGAWANVCALPGDDARVPFDEPEVQQARRDALAWWIPLLGGDFVCLSTCRFDGVYYAGAITVARSPQQFANDPFARIFPGTRVQQSLLCPVPAPSGPVIERSAGAPWPGGRFE